VSDFYLHGYTPQEQNRLRTQARFLEDRVFEKIDFLGASSLLEIGCGVGAQTEILLKRFPNTRITAVDREESQLAAAVKTDRVGFLKADAAHLPFKSNTFEGIFICWFLEHVPNPLDVLKEAHRVLQPEGVVYATEVMNSSFYLYPESSALTAYWKAYNELQVKMGGDPQVGIKLGNLFLQAGFSQVDTWPLFFHLDQRNPETLRQMLDYWKDLLLSAHEYLVENQLIDKAIVTSLETEIEELKRSPEAVFSYTSIQCRGFRKI